MINPRGTTHFGAARPAQPLPALVELPALTAAQERILAYSRGSPGLTIRQMAKALGVSHATMTYHLGLLVRKSMLTRDRHGREVRHYPVGYERGDVVVEALCRDPRKRLVYEFLAGRPEAMSINRMAQALDLPFGSLKRTLEQFERQGFVTLQRARFRYMVSIAPGWPVKAPQVVPRPAVQPIELFA